jgi:hypothetical protein
VNLTNLDIIAAEIDSQIPICSPFGLPVHVGRSHDLHAVLAQFAATASDLH